VRRTLLLSFAAAGVVFCVVQDRVTAAGARRYVAEQRRAVEAGHPPVAVAEVMEPAIRRSVEQGAVWGVATFFAGLTCGDIMRRRRRE
jgi:hypothetical protein